MQGIRQKIADLEKDVMAAEEEVARYGRDGHQDRARKSLHRLEADLKYLSVLANGAPVDRSEDMRIADFLRIHYNRLRECRCKLGGRRLP